MRHGRSFCLLLFVAWLCCSLFLATYSEAATTYYLNPASGIDANNGCCATQGAGANGPWKTMQKVKTSTGAGDTVNVIGGTYTPSQYKGSSGIPSWNESHSHGSVGNPITIQARPGDTVIFDGAGETYWMNITGASQTDRHLVIQNLTFQNYGGTAISVYIANYVVVQNCRFLNNGADGSSLSVGFASHVIFRNNFIDSTATHGIYFSEGATFSLIANNTILNVGALGTGPSGAAFGMHGWGHSDPTTIQNVILRNNIVANALTGSWIYAGGVYSNIYIYNNTLYQDSAHQTTYGMFSTHNGGAFSHIITKNNIGDGYATPANVVSDPGQTYTGLVLDYNLWRNQAGAPLYYWNGSNYTLSAFQATLGYELHSLNVNPLFTNPAAKDFSLQPSSPAINAGSLLTTTTSTGSGTVIPVADAGFFIDGFGLVLGDMIQVGSNSPVRITGVNYAANTLTVTPSIGWSSGQGVSLPYNGTAPDMGAAEVTTTPPTGATYYLNPASGIDSNNGCCVSGAPPNGPWKTMQKVRTTVVAGDTVNIVGGTYTPGQYRGESNPSPRWDHTHSHGSPGLPIIIQANPGDTVVFDGQFQVYWMLFRADAAYPGHYVIVRNLTFHHYSGSAIGIGTNGLAPTHHVAVVNCVFQNFTSNQAGAIGSMIGHHHLFKGNRITNIGDPTLGGDGLPDSQHAFYISHDSHDIVIDQNSMEQISGFGVHGYGGFQAGSTSGNWIVRGNTIVNTWSSSIIYAGDVFSNIYTYHNTLYNVQVPFPALGSTSHNALLSTHNGGTYTNLVALNNLGVGYEVQAPVWADVATPFTFATMDYNLWYNQLAPTSVYKWNNTLYTLATFRSATPGTQEDHALNALPVFTNAPARDFSLVPGSLGIDAGTALTTTVGSGIASTTLTVADAGFFHDGYGFGASLPGDTIKVGTQPLVTVTNVDYATNTLTVTPAISWSSGQGVSLPYNGSAPDMGAAEVVTAPTATQLAFTAQPQSTTPGATLAPIVVEVRTAAGALDTTSTALVTLALSGGPGFFPGTAALQTQTFATPKTGRYVRLVTLADANGSNSASAAEVTVLNAGTPIPQPGMSVVSISSQESDACCGGPHLATHALDGNTSTYWYTRYTGGKLGPPYTLILDLGASYPVNGWTYLSHQLADPDGHVTQYTFSVSTDGSTWGTALTDAGLTGTLTRNAVGGVATFPGLSIATAAPDYRLTASAPGLAAANSATFSILAPSSGSLTMAWDAPTTYTDGSAVPPGGISGYMWYLGTSSQLYTRVLDVGLVTQATTTGLDDTLVYYSVVTAYDSAHQESGLSTPEVVIPVASLSAPQMLQVRRVGH
jgi:hypothetical protein